MSFGSQGVWGNSKRKQRRPLSSIILQEGVIHSLVQDAREFLHSEDWYIKAGIPHRRGYLLHGPPGTGKSTSNLHVSSFRARQFIDVYTLSHRFHDLCRRRRTWSRDLLALTRFGIVSSRILYNVQSTYLIHHSIDDNFLQRAVSAIPKNAIFLIEDIDCAFPSREDGEDGEDSPFPDVSKFGPMAMAGQRMARPVAPITLSGLLNVLDGVGSEEGKIFFATVRITFALS
jgi:chaperone BCS1